MRRGTLETMRLGFPLVLLLAAGAGSAQEARLESEPALLVEVLVEDDRVKLGEIVRDGAHVPDVHGVPQHESLFFEALGEDGEVRYAGLIGDMCLLQRPPDPVPAGWKPSSTVADIIVIPESAGATELVIYRRVSDDPDTGRKVLSRTKVPAR